MESKLRKAGIIGIGHVGAHVMYSLAMLGTVDEIVLVDQNGEKAASERQDLFDAVSLLPHRVRISVGEVEDLGDCDVIIHSAGKIELLIGSTDRSLETDYTIKAVHTWVDRLRETGFDGVLINISNPCDVVTREIAMNLGLPKGHVFGTGTGLDTARLLSQLAEKTGVDHKAITAYMIGEHGMAQFAPRSCVAFRGVPLDKLAAEDEAFRFDLEEVQQNAVMGGWVTFSGKHCTEYAIGLTAAKMAGYVLTDEKMIMPASMLLEGEYGESDLFVGVPCLIGRDGVEKVLELPLTEAELAKFHECCDSIRKNMAIADGMFPKA